MRKTVKVLGVLCLVGLLVAVATAVTQACTIDMKPSVAANGHYAVLNKILVTPKTYPTWAPFTFAQNFAPHQSITMTENRAALLKVMMPQAFGRPWRWNFGDGHTVMGNTVTHSFAKPGLYRIVVDAYFPAYKPHWLQFDAVNLRVRG